ncbi:tetratricopeptide repeat protein, partial [bacterium]|nr:tetratricopeptide repeat protein [bacterium]
MIQARFVRLSFIIIAIFISEVLFAYSDFTVERRVEIFNQAASLLDEGENIRAAEILKTHIKKCPADLEIVSQFIKSYAKMCDIGEAERFLDNCVSKSTVEKNPLLTNFVFAEKKLYSREFDKGIEYFDKVLLSLENTGDSISLAACLLEKTKCCIGKRDADLALRLTDKFAENIGNILGAGRLTLESLALKAQYLNMLDRLNEADSIYIFVQDRAYFKGYLGLQFFCLNGRARGLEKQQRIMEAEHLYKKAYNKALIVNDTEKTAIILNNLGQIETRLGEYSIAAEYLNEAKLLAEGCGSNWLLGYIFYGLGSIAELSEERSKALEYFRSSLELHKSAENKWGELGTRLRIGYNFSENGDYSESISHFKYCLKEYERMGSLYGQSWALGSLAMAFHKLGDLASAEKYYKRTYRVREKIGDKKGAAWSRNFLGMVCNLIGRHGEALFYEFEAADKYREIGDRRGEGMAYFSIGSVYFYLGNYKKAMNNYDKAFVIATETSDNDLLNRVVSGMGSVYSSVGKLDKVEGLYIKAVELTRGLNNHSATVWS